MKTTMLMLLLLLCRTVPCSGQASGGNGMVTGMLMDSVSGKPLTFAVVALQNGDRDVATTLTDSTGKFLLTGIADGHYRLAFNAMGYRIHVTTQFAIGPPDHTFQAGNISLVQEATMLKTVSVKGRKPLIEQRPDGIHFNTASLPTVAAGDGADLLRKVPLISVDQNGGISLRGSSNIKVFIDGKPSDIYAPSVADALKAIRGENIVRVEVITHPSARYDAEGTDGVVNIITRKNTDRATNGNLGILLGNRSENVMGDVKGKYGKWVFNADGFLQGYRNRNGSVLRRDTGETGIVQRNETRQRGHYFFGGANVIYSPDSLQTLNFGYRARRNFFKTHQESDNNSFVNNIETPLFQRNIMTPNGNDGNSFNAGYSIISKDKKKEFSLLGMYFLFTGTNGYDLEQSRDEVVGLRELMENVSRNRDATVQADYSHAVNDHLKWEAGGKWIQKRLASDSRFENYAFDSEEYVNDPVRSNDFGYRSNIYAAYTSVSGKVRNWSYIAGLRYERTDLNAVFKDTSLTIPSFNNLVPNALISWGINEKTALKLGYTMKLARPYFSYLNPTVVNSDSLNIQFGNPYLRPEITNRFQLTYTKTGTSLFTDLSLFYNINRNSIENIRSQLPGGVFTSTWKNIGINERTGLSASFNWKPTTKLTLSSTVTVQYVRLESRALGISNRGIMREWVLNASYKLPAGFSVDFYGFFDAKRLMLQGQREGWKFYNMTLNKKSKDQRFNISLRVETFLTPHTFIDEEITTGDYRQLLTNRFQNQNIRLTFSYKLGKKDIKGPRVRQAEQD